MALKNILSHKMTTLAALGLIVLSFLGGTWFQYRYSARQESSAGRKILYYVDPMHPSYKSDKPGIAPDCGMKLEPVYEDGSVGGGSAESAALLPGTVTISADRQQLIGVKVGVVEKKPVSQTIRVLGRVAVDETRIYRINSTVEGWIINTSSAASGSFVKKDEVLAQFFAPEFLAAENAYIFALTAQDRSAIAPGTKAAVGSQLEQFQISLLQYRDTLRNLGMGDPQIERLHETRVYIENIDLLSPGDGIILQRNVSRGQRFEKGFEMFRMADLRHVWILADIFENEAQFFTPGSVVRVRLPHQGKEFSARVSKAVPQFDNVSRTLKVRLEADNPGTVLLPDMFVDIELPVHYPPTFTVPVDAVVDTGLRKIVFVEKGNGMFEPRRVETGWRRGGLVEITHGLMNGERIVVSGTFMIDSESRMQAAAMGIYDEGVMDPVCGMYTDEKKARTAGRYQKEGNETYYFCSPECQHDFGKNPKKYISKRMAPPMAEQTGMEQPRHVHEADALRQSRQLGDRMRYAEGQKVREEMRKVWKEEGRLEPKPNAMEPDDKHHGAMEHGAAEQHK